MSKEPTGVNLDALGDVDLRRVVRVLARQATETTFFGGTVTALEFGAFVIGVLEEAGIVRLAPAAAEDAHDDAGQ